MQIDMNMTLQQFADGLKEEFKNNCYALALARGHLEGLIEDAGPDGDMIAHSVIVKARQDVIRLGLATCNNKMMIRLMKRMGVQM